MTEDAMISKVIKPAALPHKEELYQQQALQTSQNGPSTLNKQLENFPTTNSRLFNSNILFKAIIMVKITASVFALLAAVSFTTAAPASLFARGICRDDLSETWERGNVRPCLFFAFCLCPPRILPLHHNFQAFSFPAQLDPAASLTRDTNRPPRPPNASANSLPWGTNPAWVRSLPCSSRSAAPRSSWGSRRCRPRKPPPPQRHVRMSQGVRASLWICVPEVMALSWDRTRRGAMVT